MPMPFRGAAKRLDAIDWPRIARGRVTRTGRPQSAATREKLRQHWADKALRARDEENLRKKRAARTAQTTQKLLKYE